jgi:hypothetical protein
LLRFAINDRASRRFAVRDDISHTAKSSKIHFPLKSCCLAFFAPLRLDSEHALGDG